MRVYLYKGFNIGILFSHNTFTQHDIDNLNTKSIIRISSSTSEDIELLFRYRKINSLFTVAHVICIALKSCLKRDSTIEVYNTIKRYKVVEFVGLPFRSR